MSKEILTKYELPAVVFLTGSVSLVIEVAATRILSPYFGNTIFSFSSVISTILAALSLGYYIGGARADRNPSFLAFYTIILCGGWSAAILLALSKFLLPFLGMISFVWGPLVSSLLFFFAPAFFLGMLSPFAVKLQSVEHEERGVGSVSGSIFFWSTLGSIAGSLSTGFILVPHFGLDSIMIGVSFSLIALGLIGLAAHKGLKKNFALSSVAIFGVCSAALLAGSSALNVSYIYVHDGVYERLAIEDGYAEQQSARLFFQDKSLSGGMGLDSDELVFPYTDYYELYKAFKPDVARAAFIGAGAYSMPKKFIEDIPDARVDVVDIEPSLESLARRFFRLPDAPNLVSHVADGRRFLRDADEPYDFIFSDVYATLFSIPPHFTTREFFELSKSKLTKDGVFMANIIGRLEETDPSFVMSELKTFEDVFPAHYVFAVEDPASPTEQNLIFVGLNREDPVPFESFASSAPDIVSRFGGHVVDLESFDLSGYPFITDDYAPVEYLNARIFWELGKVPDVSHGEFDGARALSLVAKQLALGSRSLRSPGHGAVQDMIETDLDTLDIPVFRQTWPHMSADGRTDTLTNLVGRINSAATCRIIVAAHYDSRRFADKDPENPQGYMPGANDGGSGVAVLLELARSLKLSGGLENIGVDLVFFDGEEGEEDVSAQWETLGSSYFAEHLSDFYSADKPVMGIVVDMVGDKDLQIYKDGTSVRFAPDAADLFWSVARQTSPDAFIDSIKYDMIDDHAPLSAAGIPSILLIDFDYPYHHTEDDTLDKVSAESLGAVGNALRNFVLGLDHY